MTSPILELQAADTMADQLRHRKGALSERDQLLAARNALVRWDQAIRVARTRLDELDQAIAALERSGQELTNKRTKLQQQLRTIISPREAEALQREIAATEEAHRGLDDDELAALEEQSRIADDLARLSAEESTLRSDYLAADAALTASAADIDAELARIEQRLDGLRKAVPAKILGQYDQLRQNNLIAAAALVGTRCEGCHLDLSVAEADTVRADAAKRGVGECPQCGRLLVA